MSEGYQPLYQHIFDDIMKKINSGVLKAGDKLPTEFQLMDQYDVSRITVTRALQELVKTGKVERFRSRGSFVADDVTSVMNHNSRNVEPKFPNTFDSTHSNTVALILPYSSENVQPLLFAVQKAVQNKNMMLMIFNSERSITKEREILQQLAVMNLAGIICHPIESYENVSEFSKILIKGTPFVTIDKTIPYLNVPCVKSDNFASAYENTEYLISKGHKNIAFYCHTLKDKNESLRFSGYLKALIDNGISPDERYFLEISPLVDPDTMMTENNSELHKSIRHQLRDVMAIDTPPTAVFCAFDLVAAYVEQQTSRLGISVPDELSVIGFDNLPLCDHLQIPLTSMSQDFEKIGLQAVELIIQMINGQTVDQNSFMFNGTIIERKSVKSI